MNMIKALHTISIILFSVSVCLAQNIILSGHIFDKNTGEKLIGANIYLPKQNTGTSTNGIGYYSLPHIHVDTVTIEVSFVGYKTIRRNINFRKDTTIDFRLQENTEIDAIDVFANQKELRLTQIGVVELSAKKIKELPALASETDMVKALQFMPGVKRGREGTSNLFVRGGKPDQNLYLLDNVPLYYVNHLGGFISVFNEDAISSIKLIKGNMSARYGGRLSSVIDIRLKEGTQKGWHGNLSLGVIASKLMIQNKFSEKTSFVFSVRRSNFDLLSRPLTYLLSDKTISGFTFFDTNIKITHNISERNMLSLNLYTGYDRLLLKYKYHRVNYGNDYNENFEWNNNWGTKLASLNWNYIFSNRHSFNLTTSYTGFWYANRLMVNANSTYENAANEWKSDLTSNVNDITSKLEFDYRPTSNHKIKYGVSYAYHLFKPGTSSTREMINGKKYNADTTKFSENYSLLEGAFFIEDEIKILPFLTINIGTRLSNFIIDNKSTIFNEPRLIFNLNVNSNNAIRFGYSQTNQFFHLLVGSTPGLSSEMWVPATTKAPTERANQYSVAWLKMLQNGKFSFETEMYYKSMNNLIEYKEGASFFGSSGNWQDKIVTGGEGLAYGAELLLRKNQGKLSGWISYAYSKSIRQFTDINKGRKFDFTYDRPHDFSFVAVYKYKKCITFSSAFTIASGNLTTLPIEKYPQINLNFNTGSLIPNFFENAYYNESRNNLRLPVYHRLDFSVNFEKEVKLGVRKWNISVYNVYNYKNPYIVYFRTDLQNNTILTKFTLFPIIPSFSYSLKF